MDILDQTGCKNVFRAYNHLAGLLKLSSVVMNSIKNENTGSSLLSTSAAPVHVENRAAVVSIVFKTIILSGSSERNFVKPPDNDQVQFTVKPSLRGDGFTKQLAQFCEICLAMFYIVLF